MKNGTTSQLTVDGAYVEFQLAVLRALPRDIDPEIADGWRNNGESLAKTLKKALLPPESGGDKKLEPKPVSPILKFVATITLSARTVRFVPKDAYVVNTKLGPHVKIGYVNPDFTKWFGEKAEEPTAETILRQYVLTRQSAFAPALKEIADSGFVTKTTPGELFSLLEKQPYGPKSNIGPLITNGYANLFEMDDNDGVHRLVRVCWNDGSDGWSVLAYATSYPDQWAVARQVFSCNSR